jgi:cobalt-zinc-cadmium efflux system membrane fusion protein
MNSFDKHRKFSSVCCITIAVVVSMIMSSCAKASPQQAQKLTKQNADALCMHNLSKSLCFICDQSLRDPKRLWCKEHNRYEDRCFECHPEAQDESRLYCKEHFFYEDECVFCHPELTKTNAKETTDLKQDLTKVPMCNEHKVPENECGICHSDLLSSLKPGQGLKIRFESSQSAKKAGITTVQPESSLVKGGVSFSARTTFNENKSSIIIARYSGTITSVKIDLGAVVRKGQVVATISSPQLAQIIAEFRSLENETRVKETEYLRATKLYESNISSRQEFDDAAALYNRTRNSLEALRQQLINSGMSPDNISSVLEQKTNFPEFEVRAPVSGTIIKRSMSVGQSVISESPVMTIVDLSSLWVHISMPISTGTKVMIGDLLEIALDGNEMNLATVNWVSPEVDQTTGLISVRAELKNPKGTLRSGMFCRAYFNDDSSANALTIPSEALARIDGNDAVFTNIESDLYEVRRIALEGISDGKAYVSQGLTMSDKVVTTGTFVVKSEFLKSRLGAGCVDD